ncbi:MAG: 4-deoxy-4-formamido-L-arabinose-phosphoundecaprenol deformylase [Victivallaceae bacterium]|nr:4-deoxy-4-formamido-L-arabinose-phosphoundecaprenol deformylase [Victivallaceae bacterium]
MMKLLALRIDVDTLRGTERGVPALCETLADFGVRGTFYFSVGPDNMGRHLWRLLKPRFLWKMLRTNAAGLYGPEIVLMGTAWPGIRIGRRCRDVIGAAARGFEVGFHAWDHHYTQAHLMTMTEKDIRRELDRGVAELRDICGREILSSAAPGWRANDLWLKIKTEYPFSYNSDCRGRSPFFPVVGGEKLSQLQIPVTLPTYDEVLGRDGVNDANYNDYQLSLLRDDALNVLTIHAEAEGGRCRDQFVAYLREVLRRGYRVTTLGEAAEMSAATAPTGKIALGVFPGREGELALQDGSL